ncbi:ATP-dependent zinc metalloprotease FtsH [Labrys miyagiensis]
MSSSLARQHSSDTPSEHESLFTGSWMASLIEAALLGDRDAIRRAGLAFALEYRGPDKNEVHRRIQAVVRKHMTSLETLGTSQRLPLDGKSRIPLLDEIAWPTTPLLMEEEVEAVVSRFVLEAKQADRLAQAGLASRFNLLLSGPPGTGKSFIAGHIAARLGLPFFVVRLDTVVSSLLGDTSKNIRALFEFAARGKGLLFLDEVDAIAKQRDDSRELGEIKRVVNTLIQGLDLLDHRTVIVAATNHAHLLDPAIFRRFPFHIDIDSPSFDLRAELWKLYLYESTENTFTADLATVSAGLTCSDIKELSLSARRMALLEKTEIDITALLWSIFRSEPGKLHMPPRTGLLGHQRSVLEDALRNRYKLTYEKIGKLVGISKQAVIANGKRRHKDS